MTDYLAPALLVLLLYVAHLAWRNGRRADRLAWLLHRERRRWVRAQAACPFDPDGKANHYQWLMQSQEN